MENVPVRNLLKPLNANYTLKDSMIFRKYLTIPKPYLKGIFQLYGSDQLDRVALDLPSIVSRCHEAYWRKYKLTEHSHEEKLRAIHYTIARIPPMYIDRNELPATTGENLNLYSQILEDPIGFSSLGRVLYFYSEFEDGAMLAASNILKSAVRSKLKCCMVPLTTFMEEVKTFQDSALIDAMEAADIACLSMLGTVYKANSGFTEATCSAFIDQRRLSGKSTILSSHLTPEEFKERYKVSLDRYGAIPIRLKDATIKATVADLAKELAALKKG